MNHTPNTPEQTPRAANFYYILDEDMHEQLRSTLSLITMTSLLAGSNQDAEIPLSPAELASFAQILYDRLEPLLYAPVHQLTLPNESALKLA